MVGRVGADPAGDRQLAALADSRVNVGRVHRTPGVPTGSATIPVEEGSGENLIVVVPGANAELRPEDADVESVHRADRAAAPAGGPAGDGARRRRATRGTVVLTPAPPQPLPAELLARIDVLVPNEHELAAAGRGAGRASGRRRELVELARSVAPCAVVVTLGARGALVVPAEAAPFCSRRRRRSTAVDTTGAGDCFCGALGQALARGEDLAARPLRGHRRGAVDDRSRRPRRAAGRRRRARAAAAVPDAVRC